MLNAGSFSWSTGTDSAITKINTQLGYRLRDRTRNFPIMAGGYARDGLHQASVLFQDTQIYALTGELVKNAVLSETGVKK